MAIKPKKSKPSPAVTSEVTAATTCKLRYGRMVICVGLQKENVFQLKPGSLLAATVRLDPRDQKLWHAPEFLVFQTRITPMFEIEQVGDGFPCKDEVRAKEIAAIIEAKNENVPNVILGGWDGGFAFGLVSNQQAIYDELVLFHYHKPRKLGKQLSNYSIRHFRRSLGKPPEMTKEEMLPTVDPETAEKMFQQRDAEIRAEEAKRRKESSQRDSSIVKSPPLTESQLLVLAKGFPETVKLFQSRADRAAADKNERRREIYAAYQRDIFKRTGKMDEALTFTQDQFDLTAKSLNNSRRRTKLGIDPIEYELVAGWYFLGYGKMPPEDRAAALKRRGLHPPSADGIRKICTRLKLPTLRKPGLH